MMRYLCCYLGSKRSTSKTVAKKKVLVLAGAGSAIEFGMPPSNCINNLFLKSATDYFPLTSDPTQNIYGYLYNELERYWRARGLEQTPNFEDALHVIGQLAAMHPEHSYEKFTSPLGAFVELARFPNVGLGSDAKAADSALVMCLAKRLVHDLLEELRNRCVAVQDSPTRRPLTNLLSMLAEQFDVAIVTTNYDDLIYRALPGIETGFDLCGNRLFIQNRIFGRASWPCLLHLHGSVHFDDSDGDRNAVLWKDDLRQQFYQNSLLRAPDYSVAGYASPASPIIVGYAKAEKIGRPPFRTYYSELARLVFNSEALLILGHSLGLGDTHLREAFAGYSDARMRRIVVIDHANTSVTETSTSARAMRVFAQAGYGKWFASHSDGQKVKGLMETQEFEHCMSEEYRVSIWYSGMLAACKDGEKILAELAGT